MYFKSAYLMSMLQTYVTSKGFRIYCGMLYEDMQQSWHSYQGCHDSRKYFFVHFNYFHGIMPLCARLYTIYVMCNWVYLYCVLLPTFFVSLLEGIVCLKRMV
jgi:hypothetical protein